MRYAPPIPATAFTLGSKAAARAHVVVTESEARETNPVEVEIQPLLPRVQQRRDGCLVIRPDPVHVSSLALAWSVE